MQKQTRKAGVCRFCRFCRGSDLHSNVDSDVSIVSDMQNVYFCTATCAKAPWHNALIASICAAFFGGCQFLSRFLVLVPNLRCIDSTLIATKGRLYPFHSLHILLHCSVRRKARGVKAIGHPHLSRRSQSVVGTA